MRKSIKIVLVFILFISSYSYAQHGSINTGILPFCDLENNNRKSELPVSVLIPELSRYKFIKLIERSTLEDLFKEIKFGMSGMVDDATVAKAGRMKGVHVLIMGTLSKSKITARAVHTETSEILAAYSVAGISEIDVLAKKLASGIEIFLAKENLKNLRNDSPKLELDFWIERKNKKKIKPGKKGTMKIGESIVFNFKANKNGYLTIVDIQPGGDVVILFPNDMSPKNKISGGKKYSIPSEDDEFEIIVSKPAGMDTVVAFFTRKKVDWLDRKKLEGEGFWTVKEKERLSMTRGFKVTATKLKSADWESKILEIKVEE